MPIMHSTLTQISVRSFEAAELLDREQAFAKEEQARLRDGRSQLKLQERQRNAALRKERWHRLTGDSKQRFVFVALFFCIALGLTLYFVLPRSPNVTWGNDSSVTRTLMISLIAELTFSRLIARSDTSFSSDNSTAFYTNIPAHFDWSAEVTIDGKSRRKAGALDD